MPTGMPSRRWCREVLAVRTMIRELVESGSPLTAVPVVTLDRRMDRLMVSAYAGQGGTTIPGRAAATATSAPARP